MNALIEQFRQAIEVAGLTPPTEIIEDGVIHRFSTSGKPTQKSGWYMLHTDCIAAGAFGDWREGFTQNWCSRADTTMTEAERIAHRERIKIMQRQREDDLARRQQSAAADALKRWTTATPCTQHDYLTRKGIQPHGVRIEGEKLLIPMRDTGGKLQSLQTIAPDGNKRFQPSGRVKGCYHAIGGKPDGLLVIAEGYATGDSIHEATVLPVAISFNAGNMEPVAVALHKAYSDLLLVMAADDDHLSPGNPGLTEAKRAALAVSGIVVVPQFPAHRPGKATDFNDLAVLAGLTAVRACFFEIEVLSC